MQVGDTGAEKGLLTIDESEQSDITGFHGNGSPARKGFPPGHVGSGGDGSHFRTWKRYQGAALGPETHKAIAEPVTQA